MILDINRIEQGVTHLKNQEVDLKMFLGKIKTEFSVQARKKNIELVIDGSDEVIEADKDALSRVLENLLSNAIKFSPNNKRVQLRACRVNQLLQFEIQDEGPGISLNEMPRLFEKFQNLTNQPTGKESSTGLGLFIVKELLTLMKGDVAVKTSVGEGTTFFVRIPSRKINNVKMPAIQN